MTRSEIALVREGYALIASRAEIVCLAFCHGMFACDLSLRALFPCDLKPLVASLTAGLRMMVESLDDMRPLLVRAPALGLRLASYGLEPSDLPTIGAAFLATMRAELGDAFTDEAHAAWRHMFWTIALAAIPAMSERLRQAA